MSETFPAAEWRRDYLLGSDMSAETADLLLADCWEDYAADGRYHHGTGHPAWMLGYLDHQLPLVKNPRVIGWADIYHDKHMNFYSRIKGENEEKSAIQAEEALTGKLPGIEVDLVGLYIRKSAEHHIETEDIDLAIFLDSDMAILGAPRPVYTAYRENIRQEVIKAPLELFRTLRIAFLETYADDDVQIFSTDYAREHLEAPAHANIQWELREMKAAT